MSRQLLLVLLFSLAFLSTRGVGVHEHLSSNPAESTVASAAQKLQQSAHLAFAGDAHHVASHAAHGDLDLDSPSSGVAKAKLQMPVLALIFFCCLLWTAWLLHSRIAVRRSLPPPRPLRRLHLLPLPNAPPV